MLIQVLRPTRGTEFAESSDSISRELVGFDHLEPKRTWDKRIPDSFNWLVEYFLTTDAGLAWFVEEDVVVPRGALAAMLAIGADISAVNYHLKIGNHRISEMRWEDKLLWCSLGCTLIRRKVFETLPAPWFSTDYALSTYSSGSSMQGKKHRLKYAPQSYAGHDIYICFKAAEAGFSIGVVEGMLCGHLVLDALGVPNVNDGCHKISRI
jgi:hypothetical protein